MKYKYATKEEIPAGMEHLYTEVGGEWVLSGIEGVKTVEDTDRLQEGLRKERNDHKATKARLAAFHDLDPDEVRTQLDKIPELEAAAAAGTNDPTKIDGLVEARLRSKLAPVERERDKFAKLVTEKDGVIDMLQGNEKRRTIHDAVRKVAGTNLVPTALEDATMLAERVMEVDESGNVVTKDNVGVTPGLNVQEWLGEMQKTRAHWWPKSEGAGAGGGQGPGGVSGSNPWSSAKWNLTEQGKIVKEHGIEKAEQLAKAAGTTIGGKRPPAKA